MAHFYICKLSICAECLIKVSIIILTHHRLDLIKKCLESIWLQNPHSFDLEIISMINGLDVDTLRYFDQVKFEHPNFIYFQNPVGLRVGEARNQIINKAKGDYLCFIDDDIELPKNYFQTASMLMETYENLDVFGGPDQTKKTASDFQLILGEVMKSFLAMGPTAKRHNVKGKDTTEGSEINLILCNLWMKRSLFKENFHFPKDYIRGEENILLGQLKKSGKSLIYSPKLLVYHERKNSIKKLVRATYYSGQFRSYGFFDESSTFRWYFLIPQLAFLALLVTFAFCKQMTFILIGIYLILITLKSLQITTKIKKMGQIHLCIYFFIVYNFVYTLGLFTGYIKVLLKR